MLRRARAYRVILSTYAPSPMGHTQPTEATQRRGGEVDGLAAGRCGEPWIVGEKEARPRFSLAVLKSRSPRMALPAVGL